MSVAPKSTHAVRGMGKILDWRGTGLLPANGGTIPVLALVHHIPVVPNVPGIADFVTLADVLRVQGLSLQFATDREGNVALYNPANRLCFQARGLNSLSCGVEHMHMTIEESWTEHQYRAAAWIGWWVNRHHRLPLRNAILTQRAPFIAAVKLRGHTTHRIEADVAGFHDRIDPGPAFRRGHVYQLARYYDEHRHFIGAPTL